MAIDIWTEKYRPQTLGDVVGQKNIIEKLKAFVSEKSLPHCLFAGSAGIGKTTSAIAMAKELYGGQWSHNFMETNASDERGIDVVRTKIKNFARVKPLGTDFKIIFLDECDSLTPPAQQALRRTMEKYSNTTRFILSCNYPSKIIAPIQSRCAIFRFGPISDKDIKKRLNHIAEQEKITIKDDGMESLIEVSSGDMRQATNLLQSISITTKEINRDAVYTIAASMRPEEVKKILTLALDKKFLEARKILAELMLERGLSGIDVIKAFHKEILDAPIDEKKKAELIDKLGEYEFRIVEGGSEDLQMEAFLAQVSAL